MSAEVTKTGPLDMQVCVPNEWTNKQVTNFANRENICGTEKGWQIRKERDRMLNGDPERQPCKDRNGYVHVRCLEKIRKDKYEDH